MDFGFDKVYIWDSKSLKDRTLPLPQAIKQRLKAQVDYVEGMHQKDIADGYGTVYMPYAFERKYPNAKYETKWQFSPHLHFSDRGIGICARYFQCEKLQKIQEVK